MRFVLGVLVVIFNFTDNATTFLCLRRQVEGYEVVEANPLARWLFDTVGLVEGLMLEMALTLIAVAFLVWTQRITPSLRLAILSILVALPAWASVNNLLVMRAVKIPLGWA